MASGCRAKVKDEVVHIDTKSVNVDQVSIMTFNVENLFDTAHDTGKKDYTFLPISKKKSKKHISGCKKIPRKKWRDRLRWLFWFASPSQRLNAFLATKELGFYS